MVVLKIRIMWSQNDSPLSLKCILSPQNTHLSHNKLYVLTESSRVIDFGLINNQFEFTCCKPRITNRARTDLAADFPTLESSIAGKVGGRAVEFELNRA